MAQSLSDIQTQMTNQWVANLATIGITIDPTQWSATNLMRLFIYTIAFCHWLQQQLFDSHTTETEATIQAKNPPSRYWYQTKLLNFQYGFPLQTESDQFDNTGYTQQQIDDSKVVKYAAIIKQVSTYGRITLIGKIAGWDGSQITQLDGAIVDAVNYYFNDEKVAPAGDNFIAQSGPADKIKMTWLIKYNPLILNASGQRIDGTDTTPVQDAIKGFLSTVYKFGGTYVPTFHIDYVQQVQGVVDPIILECYATYGALDWMTVDQEYIPDSGYLKFYADVDLTVNFIASDI